MKNAVLGICMVAVFAYAGTLNADRDEVGFAQALAKYGYFDHAEEIIERNRSKVDPAEISLIEAAMKKNQAAQLISARAKGEIIVAALDESINLYEKYISTNPQGAKVMSAQSDLAEVCQLKAVQAYKICKDATDAVSKDKWFKESEASYEKARSYYKILVDKLAENAPYLDEDPNFKPYMMNRYNIISILYQQSTIYTNGDPNIQKLCEESLSYVEEFIWDYEAYIMMYYVRIIEAMCQYQIGKAEEAVLTIKGVFDLETNPELYKHPATKEIITLAYRSKLDVFLKFAEKDPQQYNEVIKTVDTLMGYVNKLINEKAYPNFDKEDSVVMMLIDKAYAKCKLGDLDGTMADMAEIAKAGGKWEYMVGKKLSEWGITADPNSSPDILKKMIEGAMSTANYDNAYTYCTYLIKSKKLTDDGKKDFLPYAYKKLADIYMIREQYYEAAVALEMVYKTLKKRYNLVVDADIYNAARCFKKEDTLAENPYDKRRSESLLKFLVEKYPNSPYTKNARVLVAESLEDKKMYLEAAAEYGKVETDAEAYEDALARIGNCYYQYFKKIDKSATPEEKRKSIDDALKAFAKYMEYTQKNPVYGTKEIAKRQALVFSCNYTIASIYLDDTVNEYSKALELLGNTEKEYPNDGDKISRAWFKMVEAHLKMKDFSNAKARLDTAKQKYPAAPRLSYILKLAGSAFDQNGTEILESEKKSPLAEKDRKAAIEMVITGRNYLYSWFEMANAKNEKIKTEDLLALADKLYLAGKEFYTDDKLKKEQFRRAIKMYDTVVAKGDIDAKTKADLTWKIGETSYHLEDFEKAKKIFEDLYKKTEGKEGTIITMLIDVYLAEARKSGTTTHQGYDKGIELCIKVVGGIEKEKDPNLWWDLKTKQCEILLEQGKYKIAGSSLKYLVRYNPDWEKSPVSARIVKLINELKKRGEWDSNGK